MRSGASNRVKVLNKKVFLKKNLKIIWRLKKLVLPLQPLSEIKDWIAKGSKKFLKFFRQKIWRFEKLDVPLQPISA